MRRVRIRLGLGQRLGLGLWVGLGLRWGQCLSSLQCIAQAERDRVQEKMISLAKDIEGLEAERHRLQAAKARPAR